LRRPQKPIILYVVRHPYRIREIAAQAGLSQATVDRVLHGRGGVRESTVREVHQAIADLDRQQSQVRLGGRTFMIDVIVQAPPRFSAAVRSALEAELPALRPAVIRSRFRFVDDVVAELQRVARSKSHG
jgi:LacI family transcriptional regulator